MLGLQNTFDISDWRSNVRSRRERVRTIIARATVGGEPLEPIIEQLRNALGAQCMDAAEMNLLNVTIHDIRTVVRGWSQLSEYEREQFLAGQGAPSSLAARIRKCRG